MELDKASSMDRVLELLDEVEGQVERHRKKATELQREHAQLIDTLKTLSSIPEEMGLGSADSDDVAANLERLRGRLEAVEVGIRLRRSSEQEDALKRVETKIDEVMNAVQGGDDNASEVLKGYLGAADLEGGGKEDPKFQGLLLSCAAEDQKSVKQRLAVIRQCLQATQEGEDGCEESQN